MSVALELDASLPDVVPPASSHAPARPARQLAGPGEYLSFRLGDEEYGLALPCIQEIRSYQPPTRIAGASEDVCGVLNLRGDIVPVVDLRLRFGVEPRIDALTVIVVVNACGQTVGVVVDSVSDVAALTADDIRPAPAFGGMAHIDHITGIACVSRDDLEHVFLLLDIERLVSGASVPSEPAAAAL